MSMLQQTLQATMPNVTTKAATTRLAFVVLAAIFCGYPSILKAEPPRPLRALLIAGGCCHDYANQQRVLREGIQSRANVRVDVYWTDNSTTAPVFPLYSKLNWAEEYDVIIHDECGAAIDDPALVNRIVQVHKRLPAVNLHCAMHSFRTGGDEWFEYLGLQSTGHGPQKPIEIVFDQQDHPITRTLKNWSTQNEELYNNVRLLGAKPLAIGIQENAGPNSTEARAVVAWTNETQGTRSFSTTLGHNTSTVEDDRYLDLVARGLLWACDKLNDQYLTPYQGVQTTTFIDKEKHRRRLSEELGMAPEDATLVKLTASSTQNGHPPYHAIDGKVATRWCADGASYPQSITLEFEKPISLEKIQLRWEFEDRQYEALIEGEDPKGSWLTLHSGLLNGNQLIELADSRPFGRVRVTGLGSSNGGWCSMKEIVPIGEEIGLIWPADSSAKEDWIPIQADRYESSGNTQPKIEVLSLEQEKEILREVKVPDGFQATVFAAPPAVNYPVFIASTVDGTVFVSSDGNGSLGRDPGRGRIIRLRDVDGDGRADETKVFCEVDAPRGLLWDRDRLLVMHPPNLSVFFDHDDDGIADEQRTLVKNLAFGYQDRPADHTTNGISIGVDGWIYIAGGDFGFLNATGTDGSTLTHRGGGVIRVRPDGSQLELFSTGTRNILEVAVSPEMEMFARDNTNDGGGWDVRLHHFTGNDDHGYPRLFKNFNDECVQPLADYGGGSGCGAVYVAEPGFGSWGNGPFTADWGTGGLYRHQVVRRGATFQETEPPEPFLRLPRPTDADIDGNSRLYCASWKGATFKWNGPNVGYIVCVKPEAYVPPPMPDFGKLSHQDLVKQFESPSHRRRLAAQRELFYRGNPQHQLLYQQAQRQRPEVRNTLQWIQTDASIQQCIEALSHQDSLIQHTASRVIAGRGAAQECFYALDQQREGSDALLRCLAMMHRPEVVDGLITRLAQASGARRLGILHALCRLCFREGDWKGDSWGTRPDSRGPYYQPEIWDKTDEIRSILERALRDSPRDQATELVRIMQANRIQSNPAIAKMIQLAITDENLIPDTLERLAQAGKLPESVAGLLKQVSTTDDFSTKVYLDALQLLVRDEVKLDSNAVMSIMDRLANQSDDPALGKRVAEVLRRSGKLDDLFAELHSQPDRYERRSGSAASLGDWVLALAVVGKTNSSPERRSLAQQTIDIGMKKKTFQTEIIHAAVWIGNHDLDDSIWELQNSEDREIAELARQAVNSLKIEKPMKDTSPLVQSIELNQAIEMVVKNSGDSSLGKNVFERAKCSACHTVSQQDPQKGPYLGNIAKTYNRRDLTASILQPEKTIAQGFATNTFLTSDGRVLTGFVTDEQNDRVVFRDQSGKQYTLLKEEIEVRKQLPTSMMPTGILNEFTIFETSSLIEYLISIATQ